uniref:Uncharacterized protein n=1 Tax=Oryza punctata TaxID=4537 RepID=A0A0E0LCC6_ORYPU
MGSRTGGRRRGAHRRRRCGGPAAAAAMRRGGNGDGVGAGDGDVTFSPSAAAPRVATFSPFCPEEAFFTSTLLLAAHQLSSKGSQVAVVWEEALARALLASKPWPWRTSTFVLKNCIDLVYLQKSKVVNYKLVISRGTHWPRLWLLLNEDGGNIVKVLCKILEIRLLVGCLLYLWLELHKEDKSLVLVLLFCGG